MGPGYLFLYESMIKKTLSAALLFVLSAAGAGHAQQPIPDDDVGPGDQVVPVAQEGPESAPEPTQSADDEFTDEERLIQEFERYRRLISEGAFDEADTSAKRIVEMAIRMYGAQSLETSKALNNLALVQHKNGQYDAAIQNFQSAIEIIEVQEDRLNGQLVNPLKGLGSAQLGNGRPDLAVRTFNRATHITHVNEGPHNIEQVEILESLAESSVRMGDSKSARDILDRIHILNVRHFENNELGLLPSLMRRASWQHRAGYYNDERATYRRAIRIVEAKLGRDDPQLIHPLKRLGESFYFVDVSQSTTTQQGLVATGEMYFKRAARIADQAPDLDWRERAGINLSLADYYVYVDSHNRARKIYKDIWDFLSTDEERLAARREWLEAPMALRSEALPAYVSAQSASGDSREQLLTGTIRVNYTVSARGRVRNISTEAIPPEFVDMQRIVHREIRRRVFRPRMVDAIPQESDPILFEHSFYYRQSDLDELKKKKAADGTQNRNTSNRESNT